MTASFSQGTITNTASTSDLAIAGPGFFRVKDPVSGVSFVTRAGNFRFDSNGYLVTQQGYRVQGTFGAATQVAFNPSTGNFDVKTAASNPVTVKATRASTNPGILQGVDTSSLSVGMVLYSSSMLAPFNATVTKGSNTVVVSLQSSDLSKLAVGQRFSGPGISSNTFITAVSGSTITLSQSATATSEANDTYTVPAWDSTGAASGGNNHAVITAISGSTITLSNLDGVNIYDLPLSFTFITPKTTKLSANTLTAVEVPAGTGGSVPAAQALGTPVALSGYTTGGYTATVSSADGAKLRVGMTVTGTNFDYTSGGVTYNPTIVGIGPGGTVGTTTITFSYPATSTYATDVGAGTSYSVTTSNYAAGLLNSAVDYSLSNVTLGQNTATVASTTGLSVGMTVRTNSFPAGTRITAINGNVLTLSEKATATGGWVAAGDGSDKITSVSGRLYSVNVSDTGAVADGMVAKLTDPVSGKVIYAGVVVDRSSAVPQVMLDFSAFGDGTVDPVTGNNADPIVENFNDSSATGAFSIDFETNANGVQYTKANAVGDVRISFEENKDFKLVDMNGGALSGDLLSRAQIGAPKLKSFTVGTDGSIMATLSNGQSFTTGQVCLQTFLDPGALIREGDNLFSGMALAGETNPVRWDNMTIDKIDQITAGKSGLGQIQGRALEMSNVDIGEEFSQMITTQRSFQAGSRVITVTDQMLEEVVNLKR